MITSCIGKNQMKGRRPKIDKEIESEIFIRSRRRCCLCYGLNGNFNECRGQIAHIDHDPHHNTLDNLVYLCLDHHSLYDSTTRQHKNYSPDEIKTYRDKLSAAINTSSLSGLESFGEYISTENSSRIIQLPDRIIVMFDWPMRCTPTLYFFPDNLLVHGNARIEQWNRHGFQIIFDKPFSLPKFAFFADASPTEYKTDAEREKEKWKKSFRP